MEGLEAKNHKEITTNTPIIALNTWMHLARVSCCSAARRQAKSRNLDGVNGPADKRPSPPSGARVGERSSQSQLNSVVFGSLPSSIFLPEPTGFLRPNERGNFTEVLRSSVLSRMPHEGRGTTRQRTRWRTAGTRAHDRSLAFGIVPRDGVVGQGRVGHVTGGRTRHVAIRATVLTVPRHPLRPGQAASLFRMAFEATPPIIGCSRLGFGQAVRVVAGDASQLPRSPRSSGSTHLLDVADGTVAHGGSNREEEMSRNLSSGRPGR